MSLKYFLLRQWKLNLISSSSNIANGFKPHGLHDQPNVFTIYQIFGIRGNGKIILMINGGT